MSGFLDKLKEINKYPFVMKRKDVDGAKFNTLFYGLQRVEGCFKKLVKDKRNYSAKVIERPVTINEYIVRGIERKEIQYNL
ncbi:MAG: hypothetical protein OXJ52_09490 [Oligoflexia bacterium]|nr:hypothetical protein [Oligoflexia bacterium]